MCARLVWVPGYHSFPKWAIGHLHENVILLLWPESFRVLLSCANWGFCYLNHTGIIKFKYERKSEKILVVTKCRHHANGLLESISFLCSQSRITWKNKTKQNKTKTSTQISSRDFLIWQFPNFFRKGILLTCWQIHSAKALPLHCWHWGY